MPVCPRGIRERISVSVLPEIRKWAALEKQLNVQRWQCPLLDTEDGCEPRADRFPVGRAIHLSWVVRDGRLWNFHLNPVGGFDLVSYGNQILRVCGKRGARVYVCYDQLGRSGNVCESSQNC